MTKQPSEESSAHPQNAASDQRDQADPTEITSEATIDMMLGSAGETAMDLGATVDDSRDVPDNSTSKSAAAEELLGQTVDVATTGTVLTSPPESGPGAGQSPTPIREMASGQATRHTVTRFLAEGGLGKVYVAQDDEL